MSTPSRRLEILEHLKGLIQTGQTSLATSQVDRLIEHFRSDLKTPPSMTWAVLLERCQDILDLLRPTSQTDRREPFNAFASLYGDLTDIAPEEKQMPIHGRPGRSVEDALQTLHKVARNNPSATFTIKSRD